MSPVKKIRVNLNRRSYNIIVCNNKISKLGGIIKNLGLGSDAIIITNPVIKRLFGIKIKKSLVATGFNVRFEIVPDSEKAKSEKYYTMLLNNISKFDNSRRRIFIVAFGGGVIGDLAGFVASIYRRGIPYIQVPSTLLAQVDSAIGGKVAIDLKSGKNLAGAFYQPRFVLSDVNLLRTLNRKDLVSGLAEVIKYGIIKSRHLFKFLEEKYTKIFTLDKKSLQYIVYKCSSIKTGIVEKDEMDSKDIRIILNLGHTVGHAIEAAAYYSKLYTHGQAIALGMLAAAHISKELKLLGEKDYLRIKSLIKKIGLPIKLKGLDIQSILAAQEHDKKFIHGENRFVLPVKIGKVIIKENIPKSLIKESITALFR